MVVLDPTFEGTVAAGRSVARPASIVGLRVALLDNGKTNARRLLETLGEAFRRQGAAEVRFWQKPTSSRPAPADLRLEIAAYASALVTGVGD